MCARSSTYTGHGDTGARSQNDTSSVYVALSCDVRSGPRRGCPRDRRVLEAGRIVQYPLATPFSNVPTSCITKRARRVRRSGP